MASPSICLANLLCLSETQWTLILTVMSTGVVLIGVPIAIYNLRLISKTNQLESISRFMADFSSTEKERRYLYKNFASINDYDNLDEKADENIKKVVNSLNRIGVLIENKVLSPETVLSMCHTVIIRCHYLLEPYFRYQEEKSGGRYGKRIERLDARAKKFHDIRPHQRIHQIKLYTNDDSCVIYRTKINFGIKGVVQRILWRIKYTLKRY